MKTRLKRKVSGEVVRVEDTKPKKAKRKSKAKAKGKVKPKSGKGGKPKRKPKSLHRVSEDAANVLQLLIRLKASDDNGKCRCVTCGCVRHYKQMHGGHFISRSKRITKLLEENIHPQCPGCNRFGMQGGNAEAVYTLYMEDMYGRDFVDWILIEQHKIKKWVRADLLDLIVELKERVKVEESRVCGIAV